MKAPGKVFPNDKYNQSLMNNLHPSNRKNPTPAKKYDLLVIGAGPAGLVAAAGAAGLGARVALIEEHLMGGDCLNVGCVPSKCLIASAKAVYDLGNAKSFGIEIKGEVEVDFPKVMERMRKLRASIAQNDSVERFTSLGIDVFLGMAKFKDSASVEVENQLIKFRKAVITTGTHPNIPPIDGLQEIEYLTNETVFSLAELPRRLAVLGGGPIGCELAQVFKRFGAEVFLLHSREHILRREDDDAAEIVQQAFKREGIELIFNAKAKSVLRTDNGLQLAYATANGEESIAVDAILIAIGRAPNVEQLNLDAAGVGYDSRKGIEIDDHLRTTNPKIFAAGDVCSRFKFTHAADAMARMVIQNALFMGRKKASSLVIPWCTYTDPEIAHIGLYPYELEAQGIPYQTFSTPLAEVDRAVADGETEGFVKIHVNKGTDRICGATIVSRHAGDLIGELSVAMNGNIGLGTIASSIHPYPTQAEAIKKTGDAYSRTRLTPFIAGLLKRWLAWRR